LDINLENQLLAAESFSDILLLCVRLVSALYTSSSPVTGWDLQNEDIKEERGRGE
jgi:hypothetical protein